MFQLLRLSLFILFIFPLNVYAVDGAAQYQAGKDYEVVTASPIAAPIPKGKVEVVEFFNYGCPACYHFEPLLEAWLAKLPKEVVFKRVPVIFHPDWLIYTKAYYVAELLNVEKKITPVIFDAIQKNGRDLSTETTMTNFFAEQGVNPQDFKNMFNFIPGVDAQINKSNQLMRSYRVFVIPTILVNGKYKVNPSSTDGDEKKLLQVVDYLIQQELKKK